MMGTKSREALDALKERRLQKRITEAILMQAENGCVLRIRELRIRAGLTVEQLAQQLLVCKGTLSAWERGVIQPGADYVYDICCALKVEPNQLFRGTEYNDEHR